MWPWIWRWSIGTSPPAAIRRRLIIPVVAPSVSVRKSEPMMKCGENGLAAGAGRRRRAGLGARRSRRPLARPGGSRRAGAGGPSRTRRAARRGRPRRRSLRDRSARAPGAWPGSGGSSRGSTSSAARCCAPRRRGGPTRDLEGPSSSGTPFARQALASGCSPPQHVSRPCAGERGGEVRVTREDVPDREARDRWSGVRASWAACLAR